MLPTGFTEKMTALLGGEYEAFAAAFELPRNVGLRVNPQKRAALPFALEPIPWEPDGFYYDPAERPGMHPWHDCGAYYLQEPSAMAPVTLLDPQPGERVLDLCAAPGGKSTQIAARLAGRGILVSNEIHPKRAAILSGNLERMGAANALVLNEHPAQLERRFAGWFDRVLVDAPCSGEGMFRKEQAAVDDWSPDTVAMCAGRQAEILDSAAKMLRPGGRLVYSTCTFSPEEDEQTVCAFLRRHSDYTVCPVDAPWFSPGRPDWTDGDPAAAGMFRLWPHRLRGEGHFAAVLQKNVETDEKTVEPSVESGVKLPEELAVFCRENCIDLPEGTLISFGQTLYLAPPDCPSLAGLKVLRAGLELGSMKKGRFEPAHALALWLHEARNMMDLPPEGTAVRSYLSGQTLPCDDNGWTLVTVGGISLGWGKASNGVLKNHYPKGLRRY